MSSARFMFSYHLRYNFVCHAFKLSLVVLFIAIMAGEFGCFLWAFLTWHIPQVSNNSLNLLLVSDSQIQGYKNEPSGILGYITRLDVDWYLIKSFSLVMTSFSADAVINLGDLLDEGYFAKDGEFLEYKARHDKIFKIPTEIASIYVPGDNDIGGEGLDSITKDIVSRFSEHFGPINEVIKLKSFQIVKMNSLSFLRGRPFKDERWIYNETLKFIDELPSMLDKEKLTILIGHVPLRSTSKNKRNRDQLTKLIHAIRPSYVFSGHLHEPAVFHYTLASFDVTEFVVPTCSYRMGTNKMGVALAVIGPDGSIKYSVLQLPRRYLFFRIYLLGLCLSAGCASPWILVTGVRNLRPFWRMIFGRRKDVTKYL